MLPKIIQKLQDIVDNWPRPQNIEKGPIYSNKLSTLYYANVPQKWRWILGINGLPNLVKEALGEYGLKEGAGTVNNSKIVAWADEIKKFTRSPYIDWAADWYNKDSIPWCGLFMAVMCVRTGRIPIDKYLTALAWAAWGKSVSWNNRRNIWTGDIAVFTRTGGGHVAIILGVTKDQNYVLCIGGNQTDGVTIALFPISRLYAVRRPNYTIKPAGAIYREVSATGVPISTRES
jgi:uncharacterized protein (TIGR02594 family)